MSPQPQGRLLPLHHGDGGDVVGGDGDHPGSAPPEFSPSNLQLLISVSVFLCLRPPPCETPRGTIYAIGFRSRRNQGDEDQRHQSHEGERECPMRPGTGAVWAHLFSSSDFLFLGSLACTSSSFQILGPRKILGHLDVVWEIGRASCRERVFRAV